MVMLYPQVRLWTPSSTAAAVVGVHAEEVAGLLVQAYMTAVNPVPSETALLT
jgi:hypothetical protein